MHLFIAHSTTFSANIRPPNGMNTIYLFIAEAGTQMRCSLLRVAAFCSLLCPLSYTTSTIHKWCDADVIVFIDASPDNFDESINHSACIFTIVIGDSFTWSICSGWRRATLKSIIRVMCVLCSRWRIQPHRFRDRFSIEMEILLRVTLQWITV